MGKNYTNKKGITYEGEYKDNKMQGKGKYIIDEKYTYIGDFENDNIEGRGECIWINNKTYIG